MSQVAEVGDEVRNDGTALEQSVERWLRRVHGATMTERRVRQRGVVGRRGWECDVHARIMRTLWKGAAASGGGCCLVGLLALTDVETSLGAFTVGLCLLVASLFLFLSPREIWVECKSRRTKVTRMDVVKLVEACRDTSMHVEAKWVTEEAWLVSASGFDRDALSYAKRSGVRCWMLTDGVDEFREVRK